MENSLYEILTPKGFKPFKSIQIRKKSKTRKFFLKNGKTIESSLEHPFMFKNQQIKAETLKVGDFLETESGLIEIIHLEERDYKEGIDLYDIVEVGDTNTFYANEIHTHNCDASFLTSGDTVFTPEDMLFYEETHVTPPMEKRGVDSNLWIWEAPNYTRSYIIPADVARGDGTDYSTFHVLDAETCTQVAEYKGKVSPKDFGNILVAIGAEYNNALLVVENANIGWATIEQILEREYTNLFYSSTSRTDTVESYINKMEKEKLVPGFTNSTKTRPLILEKIEEYVRSKEVIIQSKRSLEEMRSFIWHNGKQQARNGYNDDLIMALAIGLYIRDTALKLALQGKELTIAQLNTLQTLNARKQEPLMTTTRHFPGGNPWVMKQGNVTEDITWLLK